MTIFEVITTGESQTEALGERLASMLRSGDFVALYGDYGAGKTAFVRGMAAALGYNGDVTSPSYTIMHCYDGDITLYHFDMYRVDGHELETVGYYDALEAGGICAVEWCENLTELPKNYYKVEIKKNGEPGNENLRHIIIDKVGG